MAFIYLTHKSCFIFMLSVAFKHHMKLSEIWKVAFQHFLIIWEVPQESRGEGIFLCLCFLPSPHLLCQIYSPLFYSHTLSINLLSPLLCQSSPSLSPPAFSQQVFLIHFLSPHPLYVNIPHSYLPALFNVLPFSPQLSLNCPLSLP